MISSLRRPRRIAADVGPCHRRHERTRSTILRDGESSQFRATMRAVVVRRRRRRRQRQRQHHQSRRIIVLRTHLPLPYLPGWILKKVHPPLWPTERIVIIVTTAIRIIIPLQRPLRMVLPKWYNRSSWNGRPKWTPI